MIDHILMLFSGTLLSILSYFPVEFLIRRFKNLGDRFLIVPMLIFFDSLFLIGLTGGYSLKFGALFHLAAVVEGDETAGALVNFFGSLSNWHLSQNIVWLAGMAVPILIMMLLAWMLFGWDEKAHF